MANDAKTIADAADELLKELARAVNRLHTGAIDEMDGRVIAENLTEASWDLRNALYQTLGTWHAVVMEKPIR